MGCTSSAPSMAPANATEKNITFSEDMDEKPVEEIDDMIEGVNQTKAIIENTVLPTCDTLDESILLSRTDKSMLETASQRIDKDVQTDSFRIDNGNATAWNESSPSSYEEEEKTPKLEEVVEQVVEMLSSGHDTGSALITPQAEGAAAAPDDAYAPPPDIEVQQEVDYEQLEEAISPSQSESSRATRWEALADIAAELPPSLAVDPLTGQIYTLK